MQPDLIFSAGTGRPFRLLFKTHSVRRPGALVTPAQTTRTALPFTACRSRPQLSKIKIVCLVKLVCQTRVIRFYSPDGGNVKQNITSLSPQSENVRGFDKGKMSGVPLEFW